MTRSTLLALFVVVASVGALPAARESDHGGALTSEWYPSTHGSHIQGSSPGKFPNEPAIAIGLLSGSGLKKRSLARQRGSDLDDEISANSESGGFDPRRRRSADPPHARGIESPFSQSSDIEDAHVVRRAVRAAQDEEGDSEEGSSTTGPLAEAEEGSGEDDGGDISYDHFPKEPNRRRDRDVYSYDDSDDYDDDSDEILPLLRRRRQLDNDEESDDDEDVYRDLDDPPLPSWARPVRDVDGDEVHQGQDMAGDDDQPDYLRQRRGDPTTTPSGEVESATEGHGSEAPAMDSTDKKKVSEQISVPPSAVETETDENDSTSISPTENGSDKKDAMPVLRRVQRSPQNRSPGYVIVDLSGFRRVRSARAAREAREAPSEVEIVKALLEAPVDETILGELPVRRSRQTEQALPLIADGSPLTLLVPHQETSAVDPAAPISTGAGDKVLEIYSVHDAAPAPPATTPAPTAIPVVPILVPESAVRNILAPGPEAHVDIIVGNYTAPSDGEKQIVLQPVIMVQPDAGQAASEPAMTQAVFKPAAEAVSEKADAVLGPPQSVEPIAQPEVQESSPVIPMAFQPPPPLSAVESLMPSSVPPLSSAPPAPFALPQDFPPPRQYFDSAPPRPTAFSPILEKTVQVNTDGSYMYSYETADGVRVAEIGMLKEVPASEESAEAAKDAAPPAPSTRLANSVSGAYSYTAPDGTYFSLRYVADENGFRPIVGESFPSDQSNPRLASRFAK